MSDVPSKPDKPKEGKPTGARGSRLTPPVATGGTRRDDRGQLHRNAIFWYAVLFFVWIFSRYVGNVVVAVWPEASSWRAAEPDSVAESFLPDSVKLSPSTVLALRVHESTRVDTAGDLDVWVIRPADTLVISKSELLAADTALLSYMSERADPVLVKRHRLGVADDLGAVVAIVVTLIIVAKLARTALRRPDEQWTALSVYVLFAILVILGVEVVDWLVSQPPDPRLVSVFKGVALASAMGGITYTLINIASKWRRAYQRLVRVKRRQQRYLLAKRRAYEKRLEDIWEDDELEERARDNLIKKFEDELEKIDARLDELIIEEMNETDTDLKEAYRQVFLDLRVVHVVMSMLLALGFVVVALALGIDFFTGVGRAGEESEQYAAAILAMAFLVGMFPRVFERFLKGVADRLIGAAEEDDQMGGLPDYDLTGGGKPKAGGDRAGEPETKAGEGDTPAS